MRKRKRETRRETERRGEREMAGKEKTKEFHLFGCLAEPHQIHLHLFHTEQSDGGERDHGS